MKIVLSEKQWRNIGKKTGWITAQTKDIARFTVPQALGGTITYTLRQYGDQKFALDSSRLADTSPYFTTSDEALNYLKNKIDNILKKDVLYFTEVAKECRSSYMSFQKKGLDLFRDDSF
jgi:hypothetical protein